MRIRIKRKLLLTTSLLIVVLCGGLFLSMRANAERGGAEAGDGGGVDGGTCAPAGSTSWNDTCFGYTWRKGAVTSNSMFFAGTAHVASGTLNGCIDIGATEYWRLGMEKYNPAEYLASGSADRASLGTHVGAILPSVAAGKIRDDISGTYSESAAQAAFLIAAKHDSDGSDFTINGQTYDQSPSFCWNPSWERCPESDPYYPTCEATPDPNSGDGYFQSKSQVTAIPGGDIPAGITATTDWDGTGEVRYSTDQEQVTLRFQHTMRYVTNLPDHGKDHGHGYTDTFATAETKYKVTLTINGSSNEVASDGYSSAGDTASQAEKYNDLATITLAPGETKRVCQVISYNPKNLTFDVTDHPESDSGDPDDPNDDWSLTWHEYTLPDSGKSGRGSSSVCATITRPSGPDSGDGTGGTGSTSSNVMFAGETADVSWDVSGISTDTRRLRDWQAVVYRVNVNVNNATSLYRGTRGVLNGNQPKSVCSWYSVHDYCDILSNRSGSFGEGGQSHSYHEAANIVVPDQVGYKYCNSFGYRYEYWWYSSDNINNGKNGWTQDKSYWRIQDASCRTIAKKPSVAIWNGSMLTAGGVTTSSSPRFDNAVMGKESRDGGARTLYGSWVEYLGAIGRNVNYFTSGASLAIGSKTLAAPKSDPLELSNSSLTISNKDRLGSSGILNNSTFRTRLTTYLENRATRLESNVLGEMRNVTATQILRYDGNLKITGNITTAPGPYSNVYNIPQVVIFVHGNLEIASDVTQIDAWLIVDGKINTCSEFVAGNSENRGTEADAIARLRDTCNKQLVFNGPVLANGLVLNRSFGADPLVARRSTFGVSSERWSAGEVFNLRMDTYLWAYAQAGRYDSSYTESYTRELAPRY